MPKQNGSKNENIPSNVSLGFLQAKHQLHMKKLSIWSALFHDLVLIMEHYTNNVIPRPRILRMFQIFIVKYGKFLMQEYNISIEELGAISTQRRPENVDVEQAIKRDGGKQIDIERFRKLDQIVRNKFKL